MNLGETFLGYNGYKSPSIKQIFDGLMLEVRLELSSFSNQDETKE